MGAVKRQVGKPIKKSAGLSEEALAVQLSAPRHGKNGCVNELSLARCFRRLTAAGGLAALERRLQRIELFRKGQQARLDLAESGSARGHDEENRTKGGRQHDREQRYESPDGYEQDDIQYVALMRCNQRGHGHGSFRKGLGELRFHLIKFRLQKGDVPLV